MNSFEKALTTLFFTRASAIKHILIRMFAQCSLCWRSVHALRACKISECGWMCHLQMLTSCFYSRQPDKRSSRHGGMSNDCSMSNDSSSCCNQAPDCTFGMQALKDEISSLKTQSGHDLESATKEARKEAVRLLGEVSLHALHLQTRACVWVSAREHVRTYHLPAILCDCPTRGQ